MDAIRVKDGKRVLLKRVYRSEWHHELEISRLFSTEPLASGPHNRCVPLEDVISPPDEPDLKFMVFPFLQQLVALPFDTIGEIVDFLRQVFTVSVQPFSLKDRCPPTFSGPTIHASSSCRT